MKTMLSLVSWVSVICLFTMAADSEELTTAGGPAPDSQNQMAVPGITPAKVRIVMIIMNDSSVITGSLVGVTADEVFVEKGGKAVTLKKSDIKVAFDADTGKELELKKLSVPAAAAAPAVVDKNIEEAENPKEEQRPHARKFGSYGQPRETQKFFEFFAYATLNNSYSIGTPLQDWMHDDVQSGSPAFYNIGGTMFMGVGNDKTFLGVGMSLNMPPSHSIWGSNLYYGGRDELVLNPYTLSVDIPFRYGFKGTGLSLTLDPALLLVLLSGHLNNMSGVKINGQIITGTFDANAGSMGMGFGLGLGAECYFGNTFGLGAKFGFRILHSALNFNSTAAGTWSPQDSNGKTIGIDLNGSYMTVGVLVKIAGKKRA